MKTYSHDYSLPREASEKLYSAWRLLANDCISAAMERVNEAREILDKYMNQDNMIEDDDVADGWVSLKEFTNNGN